MGVVPELFRHYPGVARSDHPQSSFSARGNNAEYLVREHSLDYRFGPKSPLGKLYEIDGLVLLLGAPVQTCSMLYLSQHYMGNNQRITRKAPILINGKKVWVTYSDVEYPNDWFCRAYDYLLAKDIVKKFYVGNAVCYLGSARYMIDSIIPWRIKNKI